MREVIFFDKTHICPVADGIITLPPRIGHPMIGSDQTLYAYKGYCSKGIRCLILYPAEFAAPHGPFEGEVLLAEQVLSIPPAYANWFAEGSEAVLHGMYDRCAIFPEHPGAEVLDDIMHTPNGGWMLRYTAKRAHSFRILYMGTGMDYADFMDKSDLDFAEIDCLLRQDMDHVSDRCFKKIAAAFDMTEDALLDLWDAHAIF